MSPNCPRCGGGVRPPDLMHTDWRCDACGPVLPLHAPENISAEIVESVVARVRTGNGADGTLPVWCPWPLPPDWTVSGIGWVGDERTGPRATAVALSGPAPLRDGPADTVLVAEEPGIGLGAGLSGAVGADPGPEFHAAVRATAAPAKVRVDGHPTPLWPVNTVGDRSVYVGEARGVWLYAITWPASAGYLFAEPLVLHDLVRSVPSELVFGPPSGRIHSFAQQR